MLNVCKKKGWLNDNARDIEVIAIWWDDELCQWPLLDYQIQWHEQFWAFLLIFLTTGAWNSSDKMAFCMSVLHHSRLCFRTHDLMVIFISKYTAVDQSTLKSHFSATLLPLKWQNLWWKKRTTIRIYNMICSFHFLMTSVVTWSVQFHTGEEF